MMDRVVECVDAKALSWPEKAVLRFMLWLDRTVDGGCWASAQYIADHLGTNARSVRRWRASLVEKGLLRRENTGGVTPSWFVVWPFEEFPRGAEELKSKAPDEVRRFAAALTTFIEIDFDHEDFA
ncbi:MAG: helix-turn-helix domain-containing protein, partial [Gemmatimonadetes bacterium]|nr:helix-turn-helix domain-containing protein [Gemmatimonadota bacterium]